MKKNKLTNALGCKILLLAIVLYISIIPNISAATPLGSYTSCYQEFANVSTACGGLNTGRYGINDYSTWAIAVSGAIDGDWTTYGRDSADAGDVSSYLNITYKKPLNSTGAIWSIASYNSTGVYIINQTISAFCFNGNATDLNLQLVSNDAPASVGIVGNCIGLEEPMFSYVAGYSHIIEESIYWTLPDLLQNSVTYNSTTYESDTENFILNLTYDSSLYSIGAYFFYNNLSYISNVIGTDNNIILSNSLTVPHAPTGVFYWNISLTNSSGYKRYYNSTVNTQTINSLYLSLCNSTLNITILNFTILDENNATLINSSFKATLNYGITSKSINYSYQNMNYNKSNFQFCSSINKTILLSADIEYDAPGYVDRTYHIRNARINSTQNINLRLLLEAIATKFYFNIKQGVNFLSGAIININKKFIGTGNYDSIGVRKSDSAGNFIEYLEIDKDYRYLVSDSDGNYLGMIDRNANCQAAPCTINLNLESSASDVFAGYNDYFAGDILSNLTYNPSTKIVTYTFYDITGLANYFRLTVVKTNLNETVKTICDETSYSSAGTLNCNVTGNEGDFFAKTYISRSPEKVDKYISFIITALIGGNRQVTYAIILLNFSIILTLLIASASMSRGNPAVILFVFGISILLLKMATLFPYSWTVVTLLCILLFYTAWRTKT